MVPIVATKHTLNGKMINLNWEVPNLQIQDAESTWRKIPVLAFSALAILSNSSLATALDARFR